MYGGTVQFETLFGVVAAAALIAGCAVALSVVALRKTHGLIDWVERIIRRMDAINRYDGEHAAIARVNLLVFAALLMWLALIICMMGLRAAIV